MFFTVNTDHSCVHLNHPDNGSVYHSGTWRLYILHGTHTAILSLCTLQLLAVNSVLFKETFWKTRYENYREKHKRALSIIITPI